MKDQAWLGVALVAAAAALIAGSTATEPRECEHPLVVQRTIDKRR